MDGPADLGLTCIATWQSQPSKLGLRVTHTPLSDTLFPGAAGQEN